MGSLMAGWNSPVLDPISVKRQRNKSLTREQIENFQRSRKSKVGNFYKRSNSLWLKSRGKEDFRILSSQEEEEEREEKTRMENSSWWIYSMWAFLNQPSVISSEAPTYKYPSQFHVAQTLRTPKGIST